VRETSYVLFVHSSLFTPPLDGAKILRDEHLGG
jgi:hypothetical protein